MLNSTSSDPMRDVHRGKDSMETQSFAKPFTLMSNLTSRKRGAPRRAHRRPVYPEADLVYSGAQPGVARSRLIKLLAAQIVREAHAPTTNPNRFSDDIETFNPRRSVRTLQHRPAAADVDR
ncbi:MAG: hypothetical protein ABI671_00075 [Burkholderiales bacterium]